MNTETLQVPSTKNPRRTATDQKICKFEIVNKDAGKQEFVIYKLVPRDARKDTLIRQMEKELDTDVSGYEVIGIEKLDSIRKPTSEEMELNDAVSGQFVSPVLPKLKAEYTQLGKLGDEIVNLRGVPHSDFR